MKRIITFLFAFIPFFLLSSDLKSFRSKLESKAGYERLKMYNQAAVLSISANEKAILMKEGIDYAKEHKLDTTFYLYRNLARIEYFRGNFKEAKKYMRTGIPSAKFSKSQKAFKAEACMMIAVYSDAINQKDSANFYYQCGKEIIGTDSSEHCLRVLRHINANMGLLHVQQSQLEKAIEGFSRAIYLDGNHEDSLASIGALSNVAACYLELNEPERALKYIEKGIELSESLKNYHAHAALLMAHSNYFYQNRELVKGIAKSEEALRIMNVHNLEIYKPNCLNTLIQYQLEFGNILKAEEYLELALKGIQQINDPTIITGLYASEGEIFREKKKYGQSVESFQMAFDHAVEIEFLKGQKMAQEKLEDLYLFLKNYEEASNCSWKIRELEKEILNEERLKIIEKYDAEYEITETKNELEKEELKNEIQLLHTKRLQVGLITALVGIILISALLYSIWRNKQKIEEQSSLIEQLNKELHHRTKNNFGIIRTLINANLSNPLNSTKDALRQLNSSLDSLIALHQKMYQKDELDKIDFADFSDEIFQRLNNSYERVAELDLDTNIEPDPNKSSLLGLMINELVMNSFKHAETNEQLRTKLFARRVENEFVIEYSDNGAKMESNKKGFGLRMINGLAKQMNGSFEILKNGAISVQIIKIPV